MLNITAERLTRDGVYRIVVDGNSLGVVLARSGFLSVTYSSNAASPAALPLSVRPAVNMNLVEIKDLAGNLIARATFRSRARPSASRYREETFYVLRFRFCVANRERKTQNVKRETSPCISPLRIILLFM
jgi:hypothetical protein